MASQTSSDDSTVPATAYNPDSNTLIIVVTLEDPTHPPVPAIVMQDSL